MGQNVTDHEKWLDLDGFTLQLKIGTDSGAVEDAFGEVAYLIIDQQMGKWPGH
jgi:hypothetical protein